jgi:hypothetical protein
MKIRMGFVSNSSSSSFICYNPTVTVEQASELLHQLLDSYYKFFGDEEERRSFEDVFQEPFISNGKLNETSTTWEGDAYNPPKGALVINSASDNSVPYLLNEWIEERFRAEGHHGI